MTNRAGYTIAIGVETPLKRTDTKAGEADREGFHGDALRPRERSNQSGIGAALREKRDHP